MKTALTVLVTWLVVAVPWTTTAQPTPEEAAEVYAVCTLLVGTREARTSGRAVGSPDGPVTVFLSSAKNPLTVEQSARLGEDLVSLQRKLTATFQLTRVEAVASMGAWLAAGRNMVLQSPTGAQQLVVTGAGRARGAQPPFVAVLPKDGGEPSAYERGYVAGATAGASSAHFHVKLTTGKTAVFDRPLAVQVGQRTVFARQPRDSGPIYFVVVAAPFTAADRVASSGGIPEPDPRIRAPRLLSGEDPVLPAGVRLAGDDTRVVLKGILGVNGRVSGIAVVKPVSGLTDTAVKALRGRRYEPARDETGKAIEVQIAAVIPFQKSR